jgi:hypothetical protein
MAVVPRRLFLETWKPRLAPIPIRVAHLFAPRRNATPMFLVFGGEFINRGAISGKQGSCLPLLEGTKCPVDAKERCR